MCTHTATGGRTSCSSKPLLTWSGSCGSCDVDPERLSSLRATVFSGRERQVALQRREWRSAGVSAMTVEERVRLGGSEGGSEGVGWRMGIRGRGEFCLRRTADAEPRRAEGAAKQRVAEHELTRRRRRGCLCGTAA